MNNLLKSFMQHILTKKKPDEFLEQSSKSCLNKTLTGFDLIILGISTIVGAGIFVMIGAAAAGTSEHIGAGPALIISIILAGLICIFPAFCYAEFASMLPVSGSAYVYAYTAMGEFTAWIAGWMLMLEFVFGAIAVASSWTGYFIQFLQGFAFLPDFIKNPPVWLINSYNSISHTSAAEQIPHILGIPISLNLPAVCIVLLLSGIVLKGITESANFAKLMVFVKISVIMLFVIAGAFYVKPENWTPFMPNGFKGVELGIFTIFLAYIGFDAISTAAEETKNPQKDLPVGLIGSLLSCSAVYILVTVVLTGMLPIDKIDITAPIAHAMHYAGQDWFAGAISIGALAGLTSVLLVLIFGAARILYAMSRDGFFPKVMSAVHPKYKTPHLMTYAAAMLIIAGLLFVNMQAAAELCVLGTISAFIIVCTGVIILRYTEPDRRRPFKVPFCPYFPAAGVLLCGYVMYRALPSIKTAAAIFPAWLSAGVIIYFSYGYFNQRRLENAAKYKKLPENKKTEQLKPDNII